MAITAEQKQFIETMGSLAYKYSRSFGFRIASPVVAQAILESGWGKSLLASKHNNFFGIKAGSSWKGAVYSGATKEEYQPGVLTDTTACFRVYPTDEESIIDYYRVISQPRYKALKSIADPEEYLTAIVHAGYTTATTYVSDCMRIIGSYGLRRFDMNLHEAAKAVIDGKFKNGDERKALLKEAGYDPEQGQRVVNMLI